MGRLLVGLILAVGILPGAERGDTVRLARQFQKVRGKLELSADEYRGLQAGLLAWLDGRVHAGATVEAINTELQAAGFLSPIDDSFKSHAGYVDRLSERHVTRGRDPLILVVPIFKGLGCYLDDTVVVYGRETRSRLGWFNAESSSKFARYLNSLDVGDPDAAGNRLIASGWTTSNCTSTWNGKVMRIDRMTPGGAVKIMSRDVNAQDRTPEENVSASIQQNTATFRYNGATGDGVMLTSASIARYRVDADRAVRIAPLALNRVGFLHEWLELNEADVAQWSTPEAAKVHAAVVKAYSEKGFDWKRIARCAGSLAAWEISFTLRETRRVLVFRMVAERATELRMIAVTDKETRGCEAFDWTKDLRVVGSELPW